MPNTHYSNPEYLGDGLYVVVDQDMGQIELRANDLDNPTATVFLDGYVLEAFIRYIKRLQGVSTL
jgi:hypothetical protein